ncbi:MAG: hypothetical protein NC927_00635, partial [Candidatus Omnitrophica bacterium]|nr:hypothetical protein [Candidatus Omnitrophota bacterium]
NLPLWVWDVYIKSIVRSTYLIKEVLQKVELTDSEFEEMLSLQEKETLTEEEEEYRLIELSQKLDAQIYWYPKLMKRILEADLRIKFIEEKILNKKILPLNITLGGKAVSEIINVTLTTGIKDIEEILSLKEDLYKALNHLTHWVETFEQYLNQVGIEYPSSP